MKTFLAELEQDGSGLPPLCGGRVRAVPALRILVGGFVRVAAPRGRLRVCARPDAALVLSMPRWARFLFGRDPEADHGHAANLAALHLRPAAASRTSWVPGPSGPCGQTAGRERGQATRGVRPGLLAPRRRPIGTPANGTGVRVGLEVRKKNSGARLHRPTLKVEAVLRMRGTGDAGSGEGEIPYPMVITKTIRRTRRPRSSSGAGRPSRTQRAAGAVEIARRRARRSPPSPSLTARRCRGVGRWPADRSQKTTLRGITRWPREMREGAGNSDTLPEEG